MRVEVKFYLFVLGLFSVGASENDVDNPSTLDKKPQTSMKVYVSSMH